MSRSVVRLDEPATGTSVHSLAEGVPEVAGSTESSLLDEESPVGSRYLALLIVFTLLAAFYYVSAQLGLFTASAYAEAAAPVWPPTGIALVAVLWLGYRVWPGVACGAFVGILTSGEPIGTALGVSAGNTVGAVLGAYLLSRFAGGMNVLDRVYDVFKFAVLAGLFSTAASAVVGVTSLCLDGTTRWADFGPVSLSWWLGDAAGNFLVAPLLLVCGRKKWRASLPQRWLEEAALLLFLMLAVMHFVFVGWFGLGAKHYHLSFLVIPFLVWAGFRFGQIGAVLATFLMSAIAIIGTVHESGPFGGGPVNQSLLFLQAFIATVAVTALALAALVKEREQADKELEHSHEELRNLAAHLLHAREEERTRIAREVHDDLGHALSLLKMNLRWLDDRLAKDQNSLHEKAKWMSGIIDSSVQTVRRIATELRPSELDNLGLAAAFESHVKEFEEQSGIVCQLSVTPPELELDQDRATTVFRIFQETLTNVVRHAEATAVKVALTRTEDRLNLEVRDNGKGITDSQSASAQTLGLLGIRERALLWGGKVSIHGRRGQGTTVAVTIPLSKPDTLGDTR